MSKQVTAPAAARRIFAARVSLALLIGLSLAMVAGCGQTLNNDFELLQKEPKAVSGLSSDAPQMQTGAVHLPRSAEALVSVATPGNAAYKVGPQDVLDVSVFKVPELARTTMVDDTGLIDMPLLGNVAAAGKTTRELERELAAKLGAKYLQKPQVTVVVKEYNSQRVTVEGAVKTPGVHPLKGKTSLLQLVAMSGGLDSATTDSTVVVFRQTDGKRYAAKFSVDDIRKGQSPDPAILPGDVVVANSSAIKSVWGDFLKALPIASFAVLML